MGRGETLSDLFNQVPGDIPQVKTIPRENAPPLQADWFHIKGLTSEEFPGITGEVFLFNPGTYAIQSNLLFDSANLDTILQREKFLMFHDRFDRPT